MSLWLAGGVWLLVIACSSSKSSDTAAGNDAGAGDGGGNDDTCSTYGASVAKVAPGCGGIDVGATFSAACDAVLDSLKVCTTEYATLIRCQAAGATCADGKVKLGECDAETAAYSKCGSTPATDGGNEGGSSCTIGKQQSCGTGSGCCVDDTTCGYTSDPTQKVCCVEVKKTCVSKDDCCQSKSATTTDCELGVCCAVAGAPCSTAAECCKSALCTDGVCAAN